MAIHTYGLPLNNKEHINTVKEHNIGKWRGDIQNDRLLILNYNQLLQYEDIMAKHMPNEPYHTLTGVLRDRIKRPYY